MVLQLVDEDQLDSDTSVSELLQRPLPDYDNYSDLVGDSRWQDLASNFSQMSPHCRYAL
jgi:hypothetical protein